jgi:pyridoxal phosphate enzyme (YggS family)
MIQESDYKTLISELDANHVKLVAVSKFQTIEKIEALYQMGQRDFGENYVQELVTKYEYFKNKYPDIRWHFIGHLQRNKVKYIVPFVYCIQSVDSYRLLQEIAKETKKIKRSINCLLQVFIADEDTKYGMDSIEILELLEYYSHQKENFEFVNIQGVMGMASFVDDENKIVSEFRQLKSIFNHFKTSHFFTHDTFKEISMGMSNDYKLAIQEGSTLVRIGSALFGNRM